MAMNTITLKDAREELKDALVNEFGYDFRGREYSDGVLFFDFERQTPAGNSVQVCIQSELNDQNKFTVIRNIFRSDNKLAESQKRDVVVGVTPLASLQSILAVR